MFEKDAKFLAQEDVQNYIKSNLGCENWLYAYKSFDNGNENSCFYCALLPEKRIERSLSDCSWDFHIGSGLPGCVQHYPMQEENIEYLRFGNDEGIEPLVIYRSFAGIRDSYFEISEEFRLFHNLYFDALNNKYLKIDDNGDEEEIIIIENKNDIKIKLKAIKQFLAIKEMRLVIFFESTRKSKYKLSDLKIAKDQLKFENDNIIYNLASADHNYMSSEHKSFSRIIGKKIITGVPKEKSDFWPYNEDDAQYEEFIINVNPDGDEEKFSCNPDLLSNYFGANPEAPNYLTPVFFKKEVLEKYYSNPQKYSVSDGSISCGGLWLLKIDNNHSKYVVVFLGDLGRDINYKEQLYWKSFNIPPDGTISEVCFKRSFMALPTDPQSPDLCFKYLFNIFQENWEKTFGWNLFKHLSKDDEYHYETLRIPTNDSQSEFDEQVRGLVKIIVDSINEKELNSFIQVDINGSISKLEQFFITQNLDNYEEHILFLKNIQTLRSCSVAHRKGGNYDKIASVFEIPQKSLKDVFVGILISATSFIKYLDDSINNIKLKQEINK